MRIHREGHRFLLLVGSMYLGICSTLWIWSGWPSWVLWSITALAVLKFAFFLHFFRDPILQLDAAPGVVYAPAEGRVVQIREVNETECFPKERCLQISIFMSPLNVHVNRSPLAAKVCYFRYHRGKYLVAWHPKSSTLNERTTLLLRSLWGDHPIVLRQIAGLVARRICCYVKQDDQLAAGERIGFIKFGSRVDVFLPLDSTLLIKPNMRTRCGETPLAKLPASAKKQS